MAANNQAGAASVTMTGALLPGGTWENPGVGPSVIRSGMCSFFFMPSGSTAGVVDDGNPYQGMGVDPMK